MQIKDLMSTPPASIPLDATLEEAARHMADAGVGALPVIEDDHVAGVITDRDLVVRAMACGLSPQVRVEALMSTDPVIVEADTPVPAAMHAMGTIDARHLPVVDKGRLVGVVSFDDLFWFVTSQLDALAAVVNATRKAPAPLPGPHDRAAAQDVPAGPQRPAPDVHGP